MMTTAIVDFVTIVDNNHQEPEFGDHCEEITNHHLGGCPESWTLDPDRRGGRVSWHHRQLSRFVMAYSSRPRQKWSTHHCRLWQ